MTRKSYSAIVIGWLILALAGTASAQSQPDALVRTTTDEILVLLKKNHSLYKKDAQQLYAMVYKHVLPHFDFRKMSQLVLARNWREATEDQRGRFTEEFKDLLVRTYSTALLKYTNQEIIYLPFRFSEGERTADVKTEIKQTGGGPNIPLNYRFYLKEAQWKVYDVSIEGVSLVTNYRNVYNEKVQKEGLDALIVSLAADNTQKQQPK